MLEYIYTKKAAQNAPTKETNMKILSIGNSFSSDAQRYVTKIARLNGSNFKTVNLFIGGCPLRKHYFNVLEDAKAYDFVFNGEPVGLKVSIKEALMSDTWDFVTLQQASVFSYKWESYMPYLDEVAQYAKEKNPYSKFLIHQTQVCSDTRCRLQFGISGRQEMYEKLVDAYNKAAEQVGAVGILPTGEASQIASVKYGVIDNMLYSDPGSHLSHRYGEYMAALTWFSVLTGKSVLDDKFGIDGSDEKIMKLMRMSAQEAADKYRF